MGGYIGLTRFLQKCIPFTTWRQHVCLFSRLLSLQRKPLCQRSLLFEPAALHSAYSVVIFACQP
jgi:hypothetical protein